MRYLFLDLEWQQNANMEEDILEIGAIYVNDEEMEINKFFSFVKPKNNNCPDKNILSLLKVNNGSILQGESINATLLKLVNKFRDFNIIVVWSRETYPHFIKAIKKCRLTLPEHKVIIMQDILSDIGSPYISFSRALKRYNIEHIGEYLHNAIYDAEYLSKLYFNVKMNYIHKNNVHLYRLQNSNVIHVEGCRHIKNKKNINKVEASEVFEGGKFCRHCLRANALYKMPSLDKEDTCFYDEFSEDNISKICNAFGFEYSMGQGIIFVRTKLAHWRISYVDGKIINIYHENLRKNKRYNESKNDFVKDFHLQRVKIKSLYEALKYIKNHDKRLKPARKTRLDWLFEQIETERNNRLAMES